MLMRQPKLQTVRAMWSPDQVSVRAALMDAEETAKSSRQHSGAAKLFTPALSVLLQLAATRIIRLIIPISISRAMRLALRVFPKAFRLILITRPSRQLILKQSSVIKIKVKMKVPVFTGALGSTEIARANWEHFAVGAAISGVSLICGENVCGIDPQLQLNNKGKVVESPELRRRVESYRKFYEGYGDIHVQMNVEDTKFGVAEYAVEKLGVESMELKWGQGAKCIGGEIKVNTLERALELQKRGYIVTPDPSIEANQAAFKDGALKQFERHSRLGFVDHEGFLKEVERLRSLGAKRVTLKTGAYPMRELAMAIKWSSEAKIDLLTIDGAPGGTGMSPWRMMEEWGVPTFYIQALTYEFCQKLAAKGEYVPDIAIAGGFSQ